MTYNEAADIINNMIGKIQNKEIRSEALDSVLKAVDGFGNSSRSESSAESEIPIISKTICRSSTKRSRTCPFLTWAEQGLFENDKLLDLDTGAVFNIPSDFQKNCAVDFVRWMKPFESKDHAIKDYTPSYNVLNSINKVHTLTSFVRLAGTRVGKATYNPCRIVVLRTGLTLGQHKYRAMKFRTKSRQIDSSGKNKEKTQMNFAKYRREMLSANPLMDSETIYRSWKMNELGFPANQTPIRGPDGKYHYLYLSIRDDGMIYVGKHSDDNIDNKYIGSGIHIKNSNGHSFKNVVLDYFTNEKSAYEMEKVVVNRDFLGCGDLVLNRCPGGESTAKTVSVQQNPPSCKNTWTYRNKRNYSKTAVTFGYLGIKKGEVINPVWDPTAKYLVTGDFSLMHNGKPTGVTKEAALHGYPVGGKVNTLIYWMYKDRLLSDIKSKKDKEHGIV